MKVSVILNDRPTGQVATISADRPVGAAVHTLSEKRIGALVVSEDGKEISGIVSERDIVRRLGQDGPDVLTQPVSAIMTTPVETCFASDTALDVLQRMTSGRFRHLPVTDPGGQMTGILSIGDVVKARLEEIEAENQAMTELLSQ